MTLIGPGNAGIDGCKLLYHDSKIGALFLRVPGVIPDGAESLVVEYATINSPYQYESRIIAAKELDTGDSLVSIRMPDIITQYNRRNHFRIQPSSDQPIHLDLAGTGHKTKAIEVEDISGGGLSFVIPPSFQDVRIGDPFFISLSIPGCDRINGRIIFRNLQALYKLLRVGAQFADITEVDRHRILKFIINRKLELEKNPQPERISPKPLLWILDHESNRKHYTFLKKTCRIGGISLYRDMAMIAAQKPELLVLNMDNAVSIEKIRDLQQCSPLRYQPLVLVGSKRPKAASNEANIIFMPFPLRERLFRDIAQKMVMELRRYLAWEKKQAGQHRG